MFADFFCREWNSIRVRFWSIGYKKRLFLLILVLLVLGCLVVWTSFFADLSDLNITQERQDGINDSTHWDQWVSENGLKAVGDIWDSCGEFTFRNVNFMCSVQLTNSIYRRELKRMMFRNCTKGPGQEGDKILIACYDIDGIFFFIDMHHSYLALSV